ncbi:uncharacterized protein LOC120110785 [Phoenix dactylifera]|uniref:Uncharacterized protein LOC120110785 n=1 Tax=Phoenix dactylifera TaxID=42345 RepID=A0A8B9AGB1_PHODC|nr:uncharacterized protein LOC120110785 [Phoenix dactylifera]
MVGIFSRFSGRRSRHRRANSAIEVGETMAPIAEVPGPTPPTAAHGVQVAVELKPVEHPIEPLNNDQPVKCPLPEPSILNDGRVWKERMSSASARVRTNLPVVKDQPHLESEAGGRKPHSNPPKRTILPSISAPEHNILTLLEECNAAENWTTGE